MFTIMGIAARQENLALEGMWAEVQKHMYTNPRRIGEIHINLYFPAASQLSKDQSERLIRAAKSCPVFHSLHPDIKIELHWENEK